MATDEAMLTEAINAARAGDKTRARDLLTRLLRIDKDYPDHWLWMSAVVETRQEQIYCLQNLQRVDPDNLVARRGLILMGALEARWDEVKPVPPYRKQAWTVDELEIERPRGFRAIMMNPVLRVLFYTTIGVFVVGMLWAGFAGVNIAIRAIPTPDFGATSAAAGAFIITLTPTTTPSATVTPLFRTPTPTPGKPTPLALLLDATYTPTPLYVNTPHPVIEAYRTGIRAHQRGDWDAVILFMQQVVDADPEAADAYYYMGDAQLNLGEPAAALVSFTAAVRIDDAFGAAYLGRALARLALDPEADVEEDFADAIGNASDFGPAYLARAAWRLEAGDVEGALADLIAVETLLPGSPFVPYYRALIAYRAEDYAAALPLAEAAHDGDFTHLPTYLLLGQVNMALGDAEAAAGWLEVYTRYETEDSAAIILLGQALSQTGEFERALEIYEALLALDPENADLYFARGLAYLELGDPESALDDLNRANRLRRNDFDIMLALARALLDAGLPGDAFVQVNDTAPFASGDRQEALIIFYRALALKGIVDNGDESSRPAAIRDFERALELAEFLPADLVELARQCLLELDPPGAVTPTVTPTP